MMSASFTKAIPLLGALALVTLPVAASAADPADFSADYSDHSEHHFPSHRDNSPFVLKVHDAIEKYWNINYALKKEKYLGWVIGTTCVSGPEEGAMGIHVVNPNRFSDLIIKAEEPEALIYEPLPDGRMKLVGAEYIQTEKEWTAAYPDGPPPSLEGHLMNLVGEPNRYGLHAFYEIHVWAMEDNPKGAFADWNTHVTCEKQRLE